jgi:hypothetical protein
MPEQRLYAGFATLAGGVNGGIAASLIPTDQCVSAINVTFRQGYPQSRDPWFQYFITVPDNLLNRWTGTFQGTGRYDGQNGQSGFIVARGGKLFFITDKTWLLSEITPSFILATTADFTVPALNNPITISVNDTTELSIGQVIRIDSGTYTITVVGLNTLTATYNGGAANATALAGALVLDNSGNQIVIYDEIPANFDFVFIFQAETYGIVLRGQHKTVIYDGSTAKLATANQIPAGYLGAYGWGRIWITLTDRRSFVAGNLVFDQSGGGTAQNNFRDSILFFTDNDFLNEGGNFGVPANAGDITGMQFLASQDTSLGVGVLLIGTTNSIFSCNAPPDRTTWKNLSYPIQTISLLDYGPEAPRGVISINGDLWYRSPDGFRSFLVVRRYFGQPGNVAESREISPVLDLDTQELLFYGSGVYFDNKLFYTVSPYRTANGDVAHRGMAVINFDLESSLRNRGQAAWEGISTGLNIFQMVKGRIDNNERMFMFALGNDGTTLELWENTVDNFIDDSVIFPTVITRKRISSSLITRSENFGQADNLNLIFGEFFVDDIAEQVDFTISFRPDQYPQWTVWEQFSVCASTQQCNFLGELPCAIFVPAARLYAAQITLGAPPYVCNTLSNPQQPMNFGHEFQFKIEWDGHGRIRKFRPACKRYDDAIEGLCPEKVICQTFQMCDENLFTYDAHP